MTSAYFLVCETGAKFVVDRSSFARIADQQIHGMGHSAYRQDEVLE
jgi:hypothetical protein